MALPSKDGILTSLIEFALFTLTASSTASILKPAAASTSMNLCEKSAVKMLI